jgi:hypothetical protein
MAVMAGGAGGGDPVSGFSKTLANDIPMPKSMSRPLPLAKALS